MQRIPRTAALLATLALAGTAHAADLVLTRTGGALGGELSYSCTGDTGELFVLVPALTPLPFPVPCATGNCLLNLDFGLTSAWQAGVVGLSDVTYTLGLLPGLVGVPLSAQAFTTPGPTSAVDEVSNVVEFALAAPGNTTTVGPMNEVRSYASVTTLDDGRVLIAGGLQQWPLNGPATYLDSWEIFDPQTQSFEAGAGPMPEARARHSATLLADGRVLLLGGVTTGGVVSSTGALFDPVTETFSPATPMSASRVFHTATRLNDGRVFVAGGAQAFDDDHPLGYPASLLGPANTSTELYDPLFGSWTPGPSFQLGRVGHGAAKLASGEVLLVGGVLATQPLPTVTALCRLYEPINGVLLPTPSLPMPRAFAGVVETTDDRVLVAGGAQIDFQIPDLDPQDTAFYTQPSDPQLGWTNANTIPGTIVITGPTRQRCLPSAQPQSGNKYVPFGVAGIDLTTGQAVPQTDVYATNDATDPFLDVGDITPGRVGVDFDAVDGGQRTLFVGATGATDLTADLLVEL